MIEHKLVKTGDLVCDTCRKELLNKIKTLESSTSSEDAVETDSESCVSLEDSEVGSELMDEAAMENSKSFLNSVLPLFGESPVKKSKFKVDIMYTVDCILVSVNFMIFFFWKFFSEGLTDQKKVAKIKRKLQSTQHVLKENMEISYGTKIPKTDAWSNSLNMERYFFFFLNLKLVKIDYEEKHKI